ncbi:MAG: undecaprenyl-diphosphate phosphatase [Candidatus Omnitrophica bacterium]|nr:undecaprenyl-diphosphate phosphatase [Candidatus Omnitrophota bacterium]
MTFFQAVISGVVQGVTEFLPVSSSGHLIILHHLLKIEQDFLFDIFVHLGTLIALLIFFYSDIISLFRKQKKLFSLLIIASIPTAIIGFMWGDIFSRLFVNIKSVGIMLLITAVWLLVGDISSRFIKTKKQIPNVFSAFLIGIAQGVAIIPGISRSGTTISSGLICGLDRESAFKFSFLLSIPAVFGALLFKSKDFSLSCNPNLIIGMLISGIVGYFCLHLLLNLMRKRKLYIFAIYCFAVGVGVLVLNG